ncbi:MAG TPA: Ig-like domain-containing protein, partial [Nitrososphaeraceae archaeon]
PIDSGPEPLVTKLDDNNSIATYTNETLKESKQHVTNSNNAPKLEDQRIIVDASKAAEIILKGSDPDKDTIRFEIVTDPSHGTLAGLDRQKGTVSYITNPGLWGFDSFKFKIVDSHNAESRVGTVSIIFKTSPDAPPNVSDIIAATAINKPINIDLKTSGTDKREVLKFSVTSEPLHGKLKGPENIDQTSAKVTYLPDKDYDGKDTFGFKAQHVNGVSSKQANVTVVVIAPPPTPNSLPKADTQSVNTDQNKKIGIVLRGTDTEGEKLTFSIVTDPSHGKITRFDSSSGKLVYKPDAIFSGDDSFTFKVTDPKGGTSNDARVSIKVNSLVNIPAKEKISHSGESVRSRSENTSSFVPAEPKNHHPSADAGLNDIVYSGTKGVSLTGGGKDKDGNKLTYSWKQISGPPIELNGVDTSTPIFNAPYVSRDVVLQFSLTVDDGLGGQDTDTTKILVHPQDVTLVTPSIETHETNNQTK